MEKFLLPKIIYEDEVILIIDKPSGLVVHPFDYSTEETLVDFLITSRPEIFSIKNNITLQDGRVIALGGIVHKLDRDTSGLMVVAKTQNVFAELKEHFRNHTIKKVYIALVDGTIDLRHSQLPGSEFTNSEFANSSFTINAPLGRGKKEYKQSTNPINPRGELRSAITDVEVVKRNLTTTLIKLSPKTGRTHQLRAHMSSIGHPIVGDKAYGSKIESERIMLHAERLEFQIDGKEFKFEVEGPEGFK